MGLSGGGADALAALRDHFQNGLDVFRRQVALLAEQVPQLREDPIGLGQLVIGALDDQLIAPPDDLLHAQGCADLAQVLVATAK